MLPPHAEELPDARRADKSVNRWPQRAISAGEAACRIVRGSRRCAWFRRRQQARAFHGIDRGHHIDLAGRDLVEEHAGCLRETLTNLPSELDTQTTRRLTRGPYAWRRVIRRGVGKGGYDLRLHVGVGRDAN